MFIANVVLPLVLGVVLSQCATTQRMISNAHSASSFDRLVDVGGYRLYVRCSDQVAKDVATVVMDAGHGDTSDTWNLIETKVARFARVCTYDRAGLGKSDRAPLPRTSQDMVKDLHTLLTNSGVAPPFVLVGHSFGGINIRLYASQYPDDVVGMVLVDSTHEDEDARMVALLPPEVVEQAKPEDMVVSSNEGVDFNKSMAQIREANWRSNIPLIVLTRGSATLNPNDYSIPSLAPKFEQVRLELQQDLARRSSKGKQIMAEESGHYIHRDQPELVIDSIRQVVEEAKSVGSKSP
jgi:alpha/beta hydrolase family protein